MSEPPVDRFNEEKSTLTLRGADAPDLKAGVAAIRNVLATLPLRPGVYRMQDARGDVLYIGKARALKNRWADPGWAATVQLLPLALMVAGLSMAVTMSGPPSFDGVKRQVASALQAAKKNIRYHLQYVGWLLSTRSWLAADKLSFADLAAAAKAKDEAALGAVSQAMGGTCRTCHTAHRSEKLPDGTYEIK